MIADVLAAVQGRVTYLRAGLAVPDEAGWVACDTVGAADLAAALTGSKAGDDRVVAASLLAQSYAFRVGAVSLAAYAIGLPWPSPAADATAVRLGTGRASGLAFRRHDLGDPGDADGLARDLVEGHLARFATSVHSTARLGARLVAGNLAAACAAAFRAVEGAARDRGDDGERLAVRTAADAFWRASDLGGGRFEVADGEWRWARSSCCLWYRSSGRTCEDCSLRAREGAA